MSQEEMGYGVKMEDAPDEKASRGSSSDPPSKRSQINEAKRRRCVSTACIACRKRKSKASQINWREESVLKRRLTSFL